MPMYTKTQLTAHIRALGLRPDETLLIHSSMKAVGPVEGGAETVLDAWMKYFREEGLLLFPTHTWAQIGPEHPLFDPLTEPSCVGLLTNLFRLRPGVVRSLHPTHSVAAFGRDAAAYTAGEECCSTPCPRNGCWGRLVDRRARILFLGCPLSRNTFLHGVEEWHHIPGRLSAAPQALRVKLPDGRVMDRPSYRHDCGGIDISEQYDKMERPFLATGIAVEGRFGSARCVLCDAAGMAELTGLFLAREPQLFMDNKPVPEEWYRGLHWNGGRLLEAP